MEKEFEQLKHDYSDLHSKQKELLNSCKALEDENQNQLQTIEQLEQEKRQLKETLGHTEQKLSNEIRELNERHHSLQQTDPQQSDLKQNLDDLQTRIRNYENAVSQYEEYRLKLETNLAKITQQRDTNKMDLRLTREMLTTKEGEFNQMKSRFEETEKNLHGCRERLSQNDTMVNELKKQVEQYERQVLEVNQTKLKDLKVGSMKRRGSFMI